jgi:tetratricopeptide (TPR) repeat protein
VPKWPKLRNDPGYSFCQRVLKSFKDDPKKIRSQTEMDYATKDSRVAPEENLKIFEEYSFSFKYPDRLKLLSRTDSHGKGLPSNGNGRIRLAQPDKGECLMVLWGQWESEGINAEDVQKAVNAFMSAYVLGRREGAEENQNQSYIEEMPPRSVRFSHNTQCTRLFIREQNLFWLESIGAWACNKSGRLLLVSSQVLCRGPSFLPEKADTETPVGRENWLPMEEDPSYKIFHTVMSSFACCESTEKLDKAVEHYDRGFDYAKNGQYDLAISEFTKAIEMNRKYAEAYNSRAVAYAQKGEYDQAFSDFNTAIEINPRFAKAYFMRGTVYTTKGEFDLAISNHNKALEINPRHAEAYYIRGICYYEQQEYDKAWEDMHKAQSLGYQAPPEVLKALSKASGREK